MEVISDSSNVARWFKAFDETVFKLKQGEMSGLVSTEYGVHIIQLNAIKPAAVKPFDEVRGEFAVEIRKTESVKGTACRSCGRTLICRTVR